MYNKVINSCLLCFEGNVNSMFKGLTKFLGFSNEAVIKKMTDTINKINSLEKQIEELSTEKLAAKTEEFKARFSSGEKLETILPEAFATVREAAKRTLGQRHFDVQLIGGLVLHQGKIAEMKTGEGKTLVSTLPAYLNSLTGDGVHIVTVNDYLARRDAQWMGAIFELLGVSVGVLQHDTGYLYDPAPTNPKQGLDKLRSVNRNAAYLADITYGTNNEFGFDYLRDNMVVDLSQRVQRKLSFGIVDEVDNILIDEARTPLIISGPAEHPPKEYYKFAKVAQSITHDIDYTVDEKHRTVSLTNDGINKLENLLRINNLYDASNFELVHFVENALKAQAIFQRDKDYVVKDGEVVLVDEFTGRLMLGRRYSDGLHQAIEAKEGQQVQRESITYATVTLQNYFRLYGKLSGMTGTAATEAEEFWKIYGLEVIEIPTNMPMLREDSPDLIYKDEKSKFKAVVKEINRRHQIGQPVLIGTTDINKSEMLSKMLKHQGTPHEVLNAKQHAREANIIAEAGRPGAVTVATNMAGRGTDIMLGGNPDGLNITTEEWQAEHDKVLELGGLHIIGTERHEARRIDNQLRGRSGRQGDPGSSRFYVALDDELMRRFGGERIKTIMNWAGMDDETAVENKMVTKSIENAQVKVESHHFDMRKYLVEYDDVINMHRDVIYQERNKALNNINLRANIKNILDDEIQDILEDHLTDSRPNNRDTNGLTQKISAIIPLPSTFLASDKLMDNSPDEISRIIFGHAEKLYDDMENKLSPEAMIEIERQLMLRAIDVNWVHHLTTMENLRQGIGLYAYGQRDPLVMYKKEGHDMFQALQNRIRYDVTHTIHHINPIPTTQSDSNNQPRTLSTVSSNNNIMSKATKAQSPKGTQTKEYKIGRNEPCPCGSNKKYKKCHGV